MQPRNRKQRAWPCAALVCAALVRAALIGCLASCAAQREPGPAPRRLAERLLLGPDWTEIEPEPPLVARLAAGELVLHHSPELTLTRARGGPHNAVWCPSLGETLELDIELIGKDGSVEPLASGGISPGRLGMRASERRALPELEIKRLRLRSSRPFSVSRIEWRARGEPPGAQLGGARRPSDPKRPSAPPASPVADLHPPL